MKYTLVVITHDVSPSPLPQTLASFHDLVSPPPAYTVVHRDGPMAPYVDVTGTGRVIHSGSRRGFCESSRRAWEAAVEADLPYVFWLEHDFEFLKPVDLRKLGNVLEENHRLAQLSLVRGPANDRERQAGGLVASIEDVTRRGSWIEHRAYFTTNPSLMRRDFMSANPWPSYPSECEGLFGWDLRERGMSFGLWGDGEQYVQHTGVRAGIGY